MNTNISALHAAIDGKSETESLAILADLFPGEVVFSTSLGYEDQVITDFILKNNLNISIFTLDTGRMFNETYMTLQKTNNRYDTKIKAYYPQTAAAENLLSTKGPLSFYESVENRKECCFIRKV